MPLKYQINKAYSFTDIYAHGVVTSQELFEIYGSLMNDPDWDCSMSTVTDMTDIQLLDVSVEGVLEVLALVEKTGIKRGHVRSALVVTERGQMMFARMSAAMADQHSDMPEVRIFEKRAEALEWLGIADADAAAS